MLADPNFIYPFILGKYKIYTNDFLVEPSETPRTVNRNWKERLFSWPWKPWRKTKTFFPLVPSETVYSLEQENALVMHPQTAHKFVSKYFSMLPTKGLEEWPILSQTQTIPD